MVYFEVSLQKELQKDIPLPQSPYDTLIHIRYIICLAMKTIHHIYYGGGGDSFLSFLIALSGWYAIYIIPSYISINFVNLCIITVANWTGTIQAIEKVMCMCNSVLKGSLDISQCPAGCYILLRISSNMYNTKI